MSCQGNKLFSNSMYQDRPPLLGHPRVASTFRRGSLPTPFHMKVLPLFKSLSIVGASLAALHCSLLNLRLFGRIYLVTLFPFLLFPSPISMGAFFFFFCRGAPPSNPDWRCWFPPFPKCAPFSNCLRLFCLGSRLLRWAAKL